MKSNAKYKLIGYLVFGVITPILFSFCSSSGGTGSISKRSIKINPKEQIYFSIIPFDSLLSQCLSEKGIPPNDLQENIQKEVRYQLYLKKQKVIEDEKKSDVKLSLRINEIITQENSSENHIKARLAAYRKGFREEMDIEFVSKPADENAPENFLASNLHRFISEEVLKRLELKNTTQGKQKESAVPQVIMVF